MFYDIFSLLRLQECKAKAGVRARTPIFQPRQIFIVDQIFPRLGTKAVGDITSADIQKLLNDLMNEGYSYSTVKKTYNLLGEFYRYQKKETIITLNPMDGVTMQKKANFLSAQGKEIKPTCEEVQIFTPEEIETIRAEAFSTFSDGTRKYQQPAAYFLMLNTGLRTGETLGLKNCDIDLENRVLYVRRAAKEVSKRNGAEKQAGWELIIGKPKSARLFAKITALFEEMNAELAYDGITIQTNTEYVPEYLDEVLSS